MRYQLPRSAIKAYEGGFLHAGRGIPRRSLLTTHLLWLHFNSDVVTFPCPLCWKSTMVTVTRTAVI